MFLIFDLVFAIRRFFNFAHSKHQFKIFFKETVTIEKRGIFTNKPHIKGVNNPLNPEKGANNPLNPEKGANNPNLPKPKRGLATPPNTEKGTKSPQHLKMSITGPQAQKGVNKIPNLKKG